MAKKFMPYGSPSNGVLVAKVEEPIKINYFKPYGSTDQASLLTKSGGQPMPPPIPMPPKAPRKVQRLNARKA